MLSQKTTAPVCNKEDIMAHLPLIHIIPLYPGTFPITVSTLVMSQHPEQKQGCVWPEALQLLEADVPEQINSSDIFKKIIPSLYEKPV